ncbi:meteorin-like protein [Elysia marginata]|uniref:Meteorin-like protein n=1 Tax=Elysia marginata TaxID=1093978 RepID=A0AAV4HTV9_9GAST|nr:meteorin-like protein [Elysia marginata]
MSLVCNAGTITWFGADGGVRLELTPFVHSHFRACFMAESINTRVKISREVAHQPPSSSSSSSISASFSSKHSSQPSSPSSSVSFSPRLSYKLRQLQSEDENSLSGVSEFWLETLLTSSGKSKEFCQDVGPGRPLLLFLETAPSAGEHGVPKVKFHYDVRKLSQETPQEPMDECRPCLTEEILDSYCSADFVVLGQMTASRPNPARERSDITVSAMQVIHQREPHYFQRVKRSDRHLTGTVSVSSQCGLRPGSADMLMTGKLRLTSLAFTCVTYLHEWRRIQHLVECDRLEEMFLSNTVKRKGLPSILLSIFFAFFVNHETPPGKEERIDLHDFDKSCLFVA